MKHKHANRGEKMKTTEWFPGSIKPVHVGWYEIKMYGFDERNKEFWSGKRWLYFENGEFETSSFGTVESDKWRGLTKKANNTSAAIAAATGGAA